MIGEAGLTTALHGAGYTLTERDPDYVVLGETRTYSFERIALAIRLIVNGARFIATNPDPTGPSPDGPLPATGAVAALITRATGVEPYTVTLVAEGGTATIGTPIAVLVTDGAAPAPRPPAEPAEPVKADVAAAAPAANGADRPAPVPAASSNGRSRPPSSPLARRLARENGIDLAALCGSGSGRACRTADVEAARHRPPQSLPPHVTTAPAPARVRPQRRPSAAEPQADPDTERVPLNRFRKVTARRLADSMRTAPHFYLTRTVDVADLLAFRAALNPPLAPAKVSVNDLIVKALRHGPARAPRAERLVHRGPPAPRTSACTWASRWPSTTVCSSR